MIREWMRRIFMRLGNASGMKRKDVGVCWKHFVNVKVSKQMQGMHLHIFSYLLGHIFHSCSPPPAFYSFHLASCLLPWASWKHVIFFVPWMNSDLVLLGFYLLTFLISSCGAHPSLIWCGLLKGSPSVWDAVFTVYWIKVHLLNKVCLDWEFL